jgi:hypothetical protein
MFKGKLVVLSLMVAALLCWQIIPASVNTANSGIVDPCSSAASIEGGGYCWVVCPQGDGPPLNVLAPVAGDATISITVKDQTGAPIPGIPAADFWLIGCVDGLALCGGAGSINATAASDVNGQTTINGALFGGGYDDAVSVVVQGTILLAANCVDRLCLDITVRSPDINGTLSVGSGDFTIFGNAWIPLGGVYDTAADYDCNVTIDSIDFTVFGNHWQHACNPLP